MALKPCHMSLTLSTQGPAHPLQYPPQFPDQRLWPQMPRKAFYSLKGQQQTGQPRPVSLWNCRLPGWGTQCFCPSPPFLNVQWPFLSHPLISSMFVCQTAAPPILSTALSQLLSKFSFPFLSTPPPLPLRHPVTTPNRLFATKVTQLEIILFWVIYITQKSRNYCIGREKLTLHALFGNW